MEDRIKIIVSSANIQVTFGLKEYTLKAPNRIFSALHELGHCLAFENFSQPYLGRFLEDTHWQDWARQAAAKLGQVKSGQNQVLRKYGGTNLMELFAVSLENFFERPELFREHLPDFYLSLTVLLNQDPIDKADPVLHLKG